MPRERAAILQVEFGTGCVREAQPAAILQGPRCRNLSLRLRCEGYRAERLLLWWV